jgi:hypothetical protein
MLPNSNTVFNSDSENIGLKVGSEVVVELEGDTLLPYLVNQLLSVEHSLSECSNQSRVPAVGPEGEDFLFMKIYTRPI